MKKTIGIIISIIVLGAIIGYGLYYSSNKTPLEERNNDTEQENSVLSQQTKQKIEEAYTFITDFSTSNKTTDLVLETQYVDWMGKEKQLLSYTQSTEPYIYKGSLGETLNVTVKNTLGQTTSVHWHGIRILNNEDGVPMITQDAIKSNETYGYNITLNDPGLFWFHPHANHEYQIGKGLYGIIYIPSEKETKADEMGYKRDFDEIIALKDYRLDEQGILSNNIGTLGDRTHGGMIGNFQTVNNESLPSYTITEGYGIIRIVNTSNARYYNIDLSQFNAKIIGTDGGYTAQAYETDQLLVAPGERYFVAINTTELSSDEYTLYDTYFTQKIPLIHINIDKTTQEKKDSFDTHITYYLDKNIPDRSTLSYQEPDQYIELGGRGVMGGSEGMMRGMSQERGWMLDGKIIYPEELPNHKGYTRKENRLRIIRMENKTRRVHPMHLHGDFFQVISRSNGGLVYQGRKDTVNIQPGEYVDIAIIPTNPGKRLFHCHILGHAALGMQTTVTVTQDSLDNLNTSDQKE